jgi:hypothetical protein
MSVRGHTPGPECSPLSLVSLEDRRKNILKPLGSPVYVVSDNIPYLQLKQLNNSRCLLGFYTVDVTDFSKEVTVSVTKLFIT